MPKVYLKTYGCQMNVRDSEQVSQQFIQRGYTMTEDALEADVVLINTCSVRDLAEQKALGKMGALSNTARRGGTPAMVLGFLGCMAQSRGAELVKDTPANLVVGTQKFHHVVEHVETLLNRARDRQMDDARLSIVDVEEEAASQNTIKEHVLKPGQATAFVSIMQGCNQKCAFCIVPYTRGSERSRPIPEVVEEVRRLVDQGVREVTLLGQIVNQYGRKEFERIDGKAPFVQLLEAVHEVEGLQRLRFTSPHPIGFRDDLIQAFAELPKLMPHAHFPLQSGSNRVLKLMKRGYSRERYLELIAKMRAAREGMAFTTDIIVGFPGETEEDYLETRSLVEEVRFDNAFIFKYSQRRGTPAADMPDQLPERVKEERNQDLLSLVDRLSRAVSDAAVGTEVEVLCEGPSKTNSERLTGRTPTNRVVVFEGPARLQGEIFPVLVEETTGFTLYGTPAVYA
jgi:tRNA-2-methylthio-N6-dimethylallyladenosine synthase